MLYPPAGSLFGIGCSAGSRRSEGYRRGHQGCGILLADRLAALSPTKQRTVGGQKQFGERKDRSCSFLRSRKPYGATSRVHQEDAEDTGQRTGSGSEENEGDHMKKN